MRIGILTQPLYANYGGILQNYALQKVLKDMGHSPITINRLKNRSSNFVKEIIKWGIRHIKKEYPSYFLSMKQREERCHLLHNFIAENIKITEPIFEQEIFDRYISDISIDGYIVGSDQVWRPCYSPHIQNYYLDFVKPGIKKIAYAASFGTDTWEYTDEITPYIASLAKRLDAISVRERSAVELCRKYLHVEPTWVVDPTLLLSAEVYLKFIKTDVDNKDYIVTYFLEDSIENEKFIEKFKSCTGINSVISNHTNNYLKRGQTIKDSINISVEDWLTNIYHSSFVVTDSFHGVVFSILFNRPFVVRLNGIRGNTRLESLLEDFGLIDCICTDINHIMIPKIDWGRINSHLLERKAESLSFLQNSLDS